MSTQGMSFKMVVELLPQKKALCQHGSLHVNSHAGRVAVIGSRSAV